MDILGKLYPDATTELHYSTPFQLLIAVIMSAQATDKQVNKVTLGLFQHIKSPQDVLDMGYDSYEKAIQSIGLYRSKAKNIRKLSNVLVSSDYISSLQEQLSDPLIAAIYKQYGYIIPRRIADLMQLPGV
jgi:endonuclease III